MCRYQGQYRTHYACIACRYSKKAGSVFYGYDRLPPICPHCGQEMMEMGKDFKPPRRNNVLQWKKIQVIVKMKGKRAFDSCGCQGPGPMPRTFADAKRALRQMKAKR